MAEASVNLMSPELNFLNLMSKLKHLDRTGWVRKNVKKPESVAGHMYRMAVMSAFLIEDSQLDMNRCLKMSIVHDMGESIIGDFTPYCGVSQATKRDLETSAIEKLSSLLGKKGEEIQALFQEYEDGKTPEAKLVKDLDRFDMVLQAYEYEQEEQSPGFLQEFFDSTKHTFVNSHPYVKQLVAKLHQARACNTPFATFQ